MKAERLYAETPCEISPRNFYRKLHFSLALHWVGNVECP
jgi:hypothetical protein